MQVYGHDIQHSEAMAELECSNTATWLSAPPYICAPYPNAAGTPLISVHQQWGAMIGKIERCKTADTQSPPIQ